MTTNEKIDSVTAITKKNNEARAILKEKLMAAVDSVKLNELANMTASQIEATMGIFTTADSIMKSEEAAAINNVKIDLAKQSTDTNATSAEFAVALLQQMRVRRDVIPATVPVCIETIDGDIEARFALEGLSIPDAELDTSVPEEDVPSNMLK